MQSSFNTAVDLGLSYVSEFEKSVNSNPSGFLLCYYTFNIGVSNAIPLTSQQNHSGVFHIGDILVTAMECAPTVISKRSKHPDYDGKI
jgi:hypothetical protein